MTAAEQELEVQRLHLWRLAAFEKIGVTYPEAWDLALSDTDLHQAQDMVANGCPPELLHRILL